RQDGEHRWQTDRRVSLQGHEVRRYRGEGDRGHLPAHGGLSVRGPRRRWHRDVSLARLALPPGGRGLGRQPAHPDRELPGARRGRRGTNSGGGEAMRRYILTGLLAALIFILPGPAQTTRPPVIIRPPGKSTPAPAPAPAKFVPKFAVVAETRLLMEGLA